MMRPLWVITIIVWIMNVRIFDVVPGSRISLVEDKNSMILEINRTDDFEVTGDGCGDSWKNTDWIPLPHRKGSNPEYSTGMKILYSDSGLYILFRCGDGRLTAKLDADFLDLWKEDVVEVCPCGTAYSFFTMPYMNQPVASDPTSSWQIRLKGKTFKALMGPSAAYFGDHVELSDGGDDFASSVGIGAVIGTKFTWPVGSKPQRPGRRRESSVDLTPEREKIWKRWLDLYEKMRLPQGIYRGDLYDIGFDRPETHAISKGGTMHYAFYADSFSGDVELRGLEKGAYRVKDYENGKDLGRVDGPVARISVEFDKHLLLEVERTDPAVKK